jgi:spore maturation protein A
LNIFSFINIYIKEMFTRDYLFMLNYIWCFLFLVGIIFSIINGDVGNINNALQSGASNAIQLVIVLMGIVGFWSGIMGIMEKSGIISFVANFLQPILGKIFSQIPKEHPAMSSIIMNLSANFFGLGNAATPMGIKAMKYMQELNNSKDTASDSMIMFVILNTTAVQLIPSTVIALRGSFNSVNPSGIIVNVWFSSICASIVGCLLVKVLSRKRGLK